MKGLSVLLTVVLFLTAHLLAAKLKQTGTLPLSHPPGMAAPNAPVSPFE